MNCFRCGYPLRENENLCWTCGAYVQQAALPVQQYPQQQAFWQPQPVQQPYQAPPPAQPQPFDFSVFWDNQSEPMPQPTPAWPAQQYPQQQPYGPVQPIQQQQAYQPPPPIQTPAFGAPSFSGNQPGSNRPPAATPPTAVTKCPSCGATPRPGTKFCHACGMALGGAPQAGAQEQRTATPQPPQYIPPQQEKPWQQQPNEPASAHPTNSAPLVTARPPALVSSDRVGIKALAKEQIKGKIGTLFVCNLLMGVILGPASLLFGAGMLLMPAFSISFTMIYLNLTAGITPEPRDVFKGLQLFGKALWLFIVQGFFTMCWSLLFFIPGIIKGISYSLSSLILAENPNMTAREAIQESKRLTQGHIGEMFVLQLSFIGWMWLMPFTLGLLAIWLMPYRSATLTNYYLALKEEKAMER